MKLRSLAVNQFKKFTNPMRLDGIGDGLNVVVGPNEMGKSTLLDALRAVLFEKYSSRSRPVKDLQNDRNHAAPVVELEFEIDDDVYRITKRFIKNPYVRLSCPDGRDLQGDEAEEKLRSLLGFDEPGKTGARPETLGMWSVLWVRQGQSFGGIDIPDSAQSNLHGALESEVGAVLGGKRGRALPQEIERQLDELVTPKRSQPRGAYEDSIGRVDDLRESCDDLRERRRELIRILDELETSQENLKRLSSDGHDEEARKELEDARKRHNRLAEVEARMDAAVAEQELRKHNFERAEQDAAARRQLKDDIENKEAAFKAVGEQLTEVREREEDARSQYEALRNVVSDTEKAYQEADQNVSRQRMVFNAVERDARIRQLENQREKAQSAEKRLRKANKNIASILVTNDVIKAIRKASTKLESIESQLSAAATRVAFDMTQKQSSGIKVDGQPLTVGRQAKQSSIEVVESVTISIPNRGRIRVEPAIADRNKLLAQREKARAKLKDVLESAGAKNLNDAENQYNRRQKILHDVALAEQEVELHAPATDEYDAGGAALADYIDGLRQVLKREMDELGIKKLPDRLKSEAEQRRAGEQAQKAREEFNEARAALSGHEDMLRQLHAEFAAVEARHSDGEEQLENLRRQLAEAEEMHTDDDLQAAIDAARESLSEQERAVADIDAQRADESLPQLEARIRRIENSLQERQNKRSDLRENIARLQSHVEAAEAVGLDEVIEQKSRELELAEENLRRYKREVQVLNLLLSTLRGAEQEAKERYLSPVIQRVRPYLRVLFPNAEIKIDENLYITGVERDAGYVEEFDHLSMGTQEQIAVLVRLAFAEMLVEQGHPATIVLDDALVFSDDQRMDRMFDILNMASKNVQVIILTCREQLFEGLGGQPLSLAKTGDEGLESA